MSRWPELPAAEVNSEAVPVRSVPTELAVIEQGKAAV
jgi:hypothetical protein